MECTLNDKSYSEVKIKCSFDSFEAAKYLQKIVEDAVRCTEINFDCSCAKYFEENEEKLMKKAEYLYNKIDASSCTQFDIDITLVETKKSMSKLKKHYSIIKIFKELESRNSTN